MRGLPQQALLSSFLLGCILTAVGIENSRRKRNVIQIGGLFESGYPGQQLAFSTAVQKINSNQDILPNTRLTFDLQRIPARDSFDAAKKVCRQLRSGVGAIFGPMSSLPAAHVQSICDALEIPHIETRYNFREDRDSYSINLYPHYNSLSLAFIQFIVMWKWKSFTVLYEDNEGLIRLQEVLKATAEYNFQITVRKLDSMKTGDYRPVLKDIKKRGESQIILDCHYSRVHELFRQAMSINMMTQYYHYFLTTLDVGLVNLDDFKYGGTNITAYRLVDPNRRAVLDATNDWALPEWRNGKSPSGKERHIRVETALMYDAVQLFAKALDSLLKASDIRTASLSCTTARPWDHGSSLLNYMKITQIDGLTGRVKFDQGLRTDFSLDLVELSTTGLRKIGRWSTKEGINITMDYRKLQEEVAQDLQNKTLVVTTYLEDPYMMLKADAANRLGNDRFEGYCYDMLDKISKILHFNYTIRVVADGQYGSQEANGQWTGMVRELIDKRADMAVASLTISLVREQVIDFTKPFMNLGISILFKKPDKTDPSLFSFLAPLSFEIWVYMLAAYILVSFMLFVLARFSPYEWYNPHPCNPDSDIVENQFTLLNSLWFTIGSLMQQGSEVAPRATSTRIVSGMWWFFTLIIISSYTANLAAFLTVERMTSPIENADDLSRQTRIKYGTIYGGSTMTFFKASKIPTYERMWNFMSTAKKSVFVNSTKAGIQRVKKGGYAYLLESTMNEYICARNCDLMQVNGLLDSKGYGIGVPRNSPYRDHLSNSILKLQETQVLQMLYNKWWKERSGAHCDTDEGKKDANALSIANVGGVFVVLVIGLVIGMLVAIVEFIWKSSKRAGDIRRPLCGQMADELRFAMQCLGSSTKPSNKKRCDDHIVDNGLTLMPLTGGYRTNGHTFSKKDML